MAGYRLLLRSLRVVASLLLVVWLCCPGPAYSANTFTEPNGRFTVDLPDGWKLGSSQQGLAYAFEGPGAARFLIVWMPDTDKAGLLSTGRSMVKAAMKGVDQEGGAVDLEVNGNPAGWTVFRGKTQGVPLVALLGTISLSRCGTSGQVKRCGVVFMGVIPQNERDQWQSQIETAFRSIRDTDSPATRDEKGAARTGAEPGKKGEPEQAVPGREELPKPASSAPKVNVMDPASTAAGSVAEVTESPITVRGVASDEHGIRGVQVSGQQARIEASGDIRAVQFSYSGVELQEGLNRIPVVATNVNDQRTEVVLSVWLRKTPSAQSPRKGLSESDIVDLLENYVPPQRVAAVAREKGIGFAVNSRVEERLRKAGADDALIRTLRELSPKE